METDQALSKLGKEQLWDDVSEEPLEYAGFVADQGRPDLVARAARRDARAGLGGPALARSSPSACSASAILAWRRRWEALLLGTIFLAITAISALLVASPRRVLVLIPLLAALAGVAHRLGSSAAIRDPAGIAAKSPMRDPTRPDSLSAP